MFVETMEEVVRESRVYTVRYYPTARHVWSRLWNRFLCHLRFR
ncbi:hypothetical protein LINPERPRIM_LOCUS39490 [Linum perenne]